MKLEFIQHNGAIREIQSDYAHHPLILTIESNEIFEVFADAMYFIDAAQIQLETTTHEEFIYALGRVYKNRRFSMWVDEVTSSLCRLFHYKQPKHVLYDHPMTQTKVVESEPFSSHEWQQNVIGNSECQEYLYNLYCTLCGVPKLTPLLPRLGGSGSLPPRFSPKQAYKLRYLAAVQRAAQTGIIMDEVTLVSDKEHIKKIYDGYVQYIASYRPQGPFVTWDEFVLHMHQLQNH